MRTTGALSGMLARELGGRALPGSPPACGEQQSPLRVLCNQKLPQNMSPIAGLSHCLAPSGWDVQVVCGRRRQFPMCIGERRQS